MYRNGGALHAARFNRDSPFFLGSGPWNYRHLRYYRYIGNGGRAREVKGAGYRASSPSPTVRQNPPTTEEETRNKPNFVELRVSTPWGAAVEDDSGFELVYPDGRTEEARVSGGRFRKDGVPSGNYRFRFRHIVECSWSSRKAYAGNEVTLHIITAGFPSGTRAALKVYPEARSESQSAMAELEVTIRDNVGTTQWRYEQPEGQAPGGSFVFEAHIEHNWATSAPLEVVPFPIDQLRGVKQRLRQLGYSTGNIDDELDSTTREAVKQMHESAGIPEPEDRPTELTRTILASLVL